MKRRVKPLLGILACLGVRLFVDLRHLSQYYLHSTMEVAADIPLNFSTAAELNDTRQVISPTSLLHTTAATTSLLSMSPTKKVLPTKAPAITVQPPNNPVYYFYTKERIDRVGAAIQEMLIGHAYSKFKGAVYAGACGNYTETATHLRFLEHFGLDKVLPFKCPPPYARKKIHRIIPREQFVYNRNISMYFSDEWLEDMKRHVIYPPPFKNFSIAVHIRRGDITPCLERLDYRNRYLPNQFYLDLIDLYAANHTGVNVTIFSEKESYESFDDFAQYNLALDTDPLLVWESLFASDVVILSRSSFSLVPAWLRRGKVVSGPQFHMLLPHWEKVPDHIVERSNAALKRLFATCPPHNKTDTTRK